MNNLSYTSQPVLDRSQSLAVLIDADNTSERYAHAIFEEVAISARQDTKYRGNFGVSP